MNPYNIVFLGTTGYGKSSLINALFGTRFHTEPIKSCTKELYSVILLSDHLEGYDSICVFDTPGIGEFSSNEPYQRYYEYAVNMADCIVLVLTMQRIDTEPQKLLKSIKPFLKNRNVKFIIAINHIDSQEIDGADSYIAWNKGENRPTAQCLESVQVRVKSIRSKRHFNMFLPYAIIPLCCIYNYGIGTLRKAIFANMDWQKGLEIQEYNSMPDNLRRIYDYERNNDTTLEHWRLMMLVGMHETITSIARKSPEKKSFNDIDTLKKVLKETDRWLEQYPCAYSSGHDVIENSMEKDIDEVNDIGACLNQVNLLLELIIK